MCHLEQLNGYSTIMDNKKKQELKEVIQSCHINFLFGAGTSSPFLPLLNDIEEKLSKTKDIDKKRKIKKKYCEGVMLPNFDIVDRSQNLDENDDLKTTLSGYEKFFRTIALVLLNRKSTILSKQVNIFTTNIDILSESVLEKLGLEYNDGFSGRFDANFSLSNFKKSIFKHSIHFENVSEIPVINLMKVHGSLNWKKTGDVITFSRLDHFSEDIINKSNTKFDEVYNSIAIVNPEKKKLEETVIDIVYYELLRMFSSELEKENAVLFVIGFSMADEHIREIVKRTADSNPTLRILVFSHSQDGKNSYDTLLEPEKRRYGNIEVIIPENNDQENKYTLAKVSEILYEITLGSEDLINRRDGKSNEN